MSQQPPFIVGIGGQNSWRRLSENSEHIFSPSEVSLEIVRIENVRSTVSETTISNIDDLTTFFEEDNSRSHYDSFIFLRPVHSWGLLRITFDAFSKLLTAYPISSAFADYISAFGAKTSDADGNIGGYSRNRRHKLRRPEETSEGGKAEIFLEEFSYLLRYPEKHGRTTKNPWSMRQAAVHRRSDHETKTSQWIFIHLPQSLQTEIVDSLKKERSELLEERGTPSLEFVLAGTSQHWRDYVNFLESEIGALNEKACYSCVERMEPYDYVVGFSDAQTLQAIRRRLFKAIEAVDQALDIITGIKKHCPELRDASTMSTGLEQNYKLEFLFNTFQNHRRNLVALVDFQQGASALFFKMLDQRNDRILHQQGESMNNLALEANRESAAMKKLSEMMQKDSRSMRVLTSVALVYLPASLIAAVFNSNLVQILPSDPPTGQRQHMVVTSQIWIFVVLTLSLTAATILGVLVWSKWTQLEESRRSMKPGRSP